MRTGLVVGGVSFLLVGTAALAALYLVPPGDVVDHHDSTSTLAVSSAQIVLSSAFWGENGSGATFELRWQASTPVSVSLYSARAPQCTATDCGRTGEVMAWANATSGSWQAKGDPTYPYFVAALAEAGGSSVLTVSSTGTATETPAWPGLEMVVGSVAALLVLAVGALATFLGLFLRGDAYRRSAAPRPSYRGELRPREPPNG